MFDWLKHKYNRLVTFGSNERDTFLMVLATQLSAGQTMTSIANGFVAFPYTEVVKDLGQLAGDSLSDGNGMTDYWDTEGHFTEQETSILREAEDAGGPEGLLQAVFAVRSMTEVKVSFWRTVVLENFAYVAASIYILGFMIFLNTTQRDVFAGVLAEVGQSIDDLSLFSFAQFMVENGLLMLLIVLLLSWAYRHARTNLIDIATRRACRSLGLFAIADRKFQYDMAGAISTYIDIGIPVRRALEILADIYRRDHFRNQRLLWVVESINEGIQPLAATRDNLFDEKNYFLIEQNAGDDSSEELASALKVFQKVQGILINRTLVRIGRILLLTAVLLVAYLAIGFMEFTQVMQEGTSKV